MIGLIDWFIDRYTDMLLNWLLNWLVGRSVGCLIGLSIKTHSYHVARSIQHTAVQAVRESVLHVLALELDKKIVASLSSSPGCFV